VNEPPQVSPRGSSAAVQLRRASAVDAAAIAVLLEPYAAKAIVLPRPVAEVRRYIDNFLVATNGDVVVGAVALRDFGGGLEEVRSLVVAPEHVNCGLGSRLVTRALDLARSRRARRVFTLTQRPGLFERLGFRIVDKGMFPQKVWSDCAKCPKQTQCDEIALLLELGA